MVAAISAPASGASFRVMSRMKSPGTQAKARPYARRRFLNRFAGSGAAGGQKCQRHAPRAIDARSTVQGILERPGRVLPPSGGGIQPQTGAHIPAPARAPDHHVENIVMHLDAG